MPRTQSTRRPSTLMLAHGAGAPQQHPFMVGFARALSERGLDVVTFNFLYTEQRRKVPDRMPQLVACYRAAIDAARAGDPERPRASLHRRQVDGRPRRDARGRGRPRAHARRHRAAWISAASARTPRPTSRRASARTSGAPCCSCRATRDTFGTPSELKPILASLSPLPTLHHVEGGDHSFKIAGRDAKARQAAVYAEIQDTIVEWIQQAG